MDDKSVGAAAMAWVLFVLNQAIARGMFRLRVEGVDHLPKEGPFVLAANHPSLLDALVAAAALNYRLLHQTYWGAWMGVAFENPVIRPVSRLAHLLPVAGIRSGVPGLAFGAAVLKRGQNLIWFPEGYRSYTGELQPFKPGIGMLLNHFRVPVVPTFVHGTYEAMPRGKALPRPKRITVTFGRPLNVDDLEQRGSGGEPQHKIVQALRDRVAELGARLDEARSGRRSRDYHA